MHATSSEGAAGHRGGREVSKVARASGPAGKKAPEVVRLARCSKLPARRLCTGGVPGRVRRVGAGMQGNWVEAQCTTREVWWRSDCLAPMYKGGARQCAWPVPPCLNMVGT